MSVFVTNLKKEKLKMKARYIVLSVLVLLAMVLTSCAPAATPVPPTATSAPAVPAEPTATTAPAPAEPTATTAPAEPTATTAAAPADPCAADAFGCAKIPAGQTVKIGMGAPMTGDNAQFGIDISQGAKIAVADAGDFQGFKFELVAEDDGGAPEGGAAVANKFVADPTIVAIAGHIFSGATAAAMPIYEKAGIPMMSPSATNPDLTKQNSKVFNRVAFTDAAQGKFAAEYMYNVLGKKNIAVMHDGQAYGKGLADVVVGRFKELGGTVLDEVAITPGETDYTAPLSAIAAKKPEVLYYGGYVQEAVVLVNQMGQSGLQGVVFFGCDGTYGADFISRGGKNAEGAYAVALIPPASDAVKAFNEKYMAEFGKEAGSLSPYTWNAYDSAATLITAIKQVAVKAADGTLLVPRGALVNAVRTLKDYNGLSGTITCAENGECNSSGPIFYVVKDGAWVVAPTK
jgi:branched-chain amino acid transport system substrate-binding protein